MSQFVVVSNNYSGQNGFAHDVKISKRDSRKKGCKQEKQI